MVDFGWYPEMEISRRALCLPATTRTPRNHTLSGRCSNVAWMLRGCCLDIARTLPERSRTVRDDRAHTDAGRAARISKIDLLWVHKRQAPELENCYSFQVSQWGFNVGLCPTYSDYHK